jgi:hypothetical protein
MNVYTHTFLKTNKAANEHNTHEVRCMCICGQQRYFTEEVLGCCVYEIETMHENQINVTSMSRKRNRFDRFHHTHTSGLCTGKHHLLLVECWHESTNMEKKRTAQEQIFGWKKTPPNPIFYVLQALYSYRSLSNGRTHFESARDAK